MSKKKSVSTAAPTTGTTIRKQAASRPKTKLAQLEAMLRRPDGATRRTDQQVAGLADAQCAGRDVGRPEEEAGPDHHE